MPNTENERNYYVFCDDNCKFPAMTAEQVLAAIAEATGHTARDVNAAFISKIKEIQGNTSIKFWVGTRAEYNALTPANNVFYIIVDDNPIADITAIITDLQNVVGGVSDNVDGITSKLETWNVLDMSEYFYVTGEVSLGNSTVCERNNHMQGKLTFEDGTFETSIYGYVANITDYTVKNAHRPKVAAPINVHCVLSDNSHAWGNGLIDGLGKIYAFIPDADDTTEFTKLEIFFDYARKWQ